jgi:uncharacterized membrane protein YesL
MRTIESIYPGMKMKTNIKVNSAILAVSGIIAFFLLIYILIQVNSNLSEALNIDKSKFELKDFFIGFAHLFVLFFNIFAIIVIFSHFRHYEEIKTLKTLFLICGIISLFSIGVEKVMADEIAREYKAGMDISEINILNIAYGINLLFSAFAFYFVLRALPFLRSGSDVKDTLDEKIFTIAQYMGIISGLTGLLLVFNLSEKQTASNKIVFYIPFFILFLIPYLLAVFYWFSLKLHQKPGNWYDEKQLQDIMKASLITLVLSIPGLLIFLFLGIHSIIYFFLYYIFLILILFSASTLAYYKL